MSIELGIALDLSGPDADPEEPAGGWAGAGAQRLAVLAQRAAAGGRARGAVRAGERHDGLDPWTAAVWIAGRTKHIPIAVVAPAVSAPDPADPEAPYPAVVEKARQSLDTLAGPRLITSTSAWVSAPADAEPDALRARAE